MASPVDAGRATTDITAAADPWTVNLPASIASGDLLVLFARNQNQSALGTNTGWTPLVDDNTDASNDRTVVLYRVADGTEGATMSLDWGSTCKGGAIVWRITGALTTGTFIEATVTANVGANMDPGSCAVTGGPKDVLAIACGGVDNETGSFTAAPSGYTNLQNANSGTGGAADTNVLIGGATLEITGTSSVDPDAFTNAAPTTANGGTAVTLVVHPAAAAPAFQPRHPVANLDHALLMKKVERVGRIFVPRLWTPRPVLV